METQDFVERSVIGLHEDLIRKLPAEISKQARLLDVGCGTGAWLNRLKGAGFQNIAGTDLDVEQVRATDEIPIYRNDFNGMTWSVGGRQYDVITAIEVIEHIENIGLFLGNCREHMTEDGLLLLTTPNVHSIQTRLRFFLTGDVKQFGRIGDVTHVTPILMATLSRVLARHELKIVRHWGYPSSGDAVGSRRWVNVVCAGLRLILPEDVPGDVLCVLIGKA